MTTKIEKTLELRLRELETRGTLKGKETVITGVKSAQSQRGPRFFIQGQGNKEFIRMNSNSYLGFSLRREIIEREEEYARRYGSGPGAVRFISGTFEPHVELERKLAAFHRREEAMLFSSAYAAVVGTITPLIDQETAIISDELNHNCIINAIRLSQPASRAVYRHVDMTDLERAIQAQVGMTKRVIVITDGIFSMRGDYAPLNIISELAANYDDRFDEGVVLIVDDSHGVGAFGDTGRGTEEYTHAGGVTVLLATLGKALGVNGGYMAASSTIVAYLRETAPFYIYSNPITPAEAGAAVAALDILTGNDGVLLLKKLRDLTRRFEDGLESLGYEIMRSDHPIVPIMIRNTTRTSCLVRYLFEHGVLTTGIKYPVVPQGDEEIRCQISADHTASDIDYVLDILARAHKEINRDSC